MARADLILNLVKAGSSGDQAQFRKVVEALAADERAKHHAVLADRILGNLSLNGHANRKLEAPNGDPKGGTSVELLFERNPSRGLDSLILPEGVETAVLELVEEQMRSDLLRAYNLEPRNRVLLTGPPGNGKTSLAEALADALSVPFLIVRYEAIIGSYLGETAQRISQVFDYARSRRCVLFFDEFDAVAKERGRRQRNRRDQAGRQLVAVADRRSAQLRGRCDGQQSSRVVGPGGLAPFSNPLGATDAGASGDPDVVAAV